MDASGECIIELPDYWSAMVDDYTVQLTPYGPYHVHIVEKTKEYVKVASSRVRIGYEFDYYIVGSRMEIEVVQDG